MPPIGIDLTPSQELACALRILAQRGWQENLSGHRTVTTASGGLLANPWGMWWHEVTASDIITLDATGNVVTGRWDVTPAVFLHTELHRARPDARVVIHNHPYHATLLACLGAAPTISHQNSVLFANEIAIVDEYDGTVESAAAGQWLAERIGNATVALLANHGAIVTGSSFGSACYRAVTFERACEFSVDAMRCNRSLRPIPTEAIPSLQHELKRNTADAFWGGAIRALLTKEPEVLQ